MPAGLHALRHVWWSGWLVVCLAVRVCLHLSTCLRVCISVWLSVRPFVGPSVRSSVRPVRPYVRPSVRPLVRPSVCQYVRRLYVCFYFRCTFVRSSVICLSLYHPFVRQFVRSTVCRYVCLPPSNYVCLCVRRYMAMAVSVEALVFIVIGRSCSEGCVFDSHCRPSGFLRINSRPIMSSPYCAT